MRARWKAAALVAGAAAVLAVIATSGRSPGPAADPARRARGVAIAAAVGAPSAAVDAVPDDPALRAARTESLRQRVGGLTRGELFAGIPLGDDMPAFSKWLWRAVGLLEQEPALATELGERLARGEFVGAAGELGMDLLASCGSDTAQAAMRVALSSATVQGAANYGLMLQRLSLVPEPTVETAAWVGDAYVTRGDGPSAFALGAVTGGLRRHGHPDEAAAWNARLVGDLAAAKTPEQQAVLLGAIGNAASADNVPAVIALAASPSDEVRAAVAYALRHTDTPAARTALHALIGDPDASVQRRAIDAYGRYPLGADDVAALAAQVAAGDLHDGNQAQLVSLASAHRDAPAATVALLEAIAADPDTGDDDRARIAGVLHELGQD